MKTIQPIDRQLLRYSPDQFTLRLNQFIAAVNSLNDHVEITDNTLNSDKVIVYGNQPDKTFGVAIWHKQGQIYTLITRVA